MALTQAELDALAASPKSVSGEQGSVTNRDVSDALKANAVAAGVAAVAIAGSAWGCCRPARVVPPGTVGPGSDT